MRRVILPTVLLLSFVLKGFPQDIRSFTRLDSAVVQFEKAEWTILTNGVWHNAFNAAEVALDMEITTPSGNPRLLPCYCDTAMGTETVWRARFAPQEAGTYRCVFRLTTPGGSTESAVDSFVAVPGHRHGFLHPNGCWTFKFDDGTLFRGVGENIAWESRAFEDPRFTYEYLLPKLAANGGNFFRTWICSWNLPVQWKHVTSTNRYADSKQYFNPGAISRLDRLMQLCDSLGLYIMLTLDWHGELIPDAEWRYSDYNKVNGGPAATPTEFFTSMAAQQMYKNKLRFLVSRWGYSTSIAAWEFFNEVDNAAFTQKDSIRIPHAAVTQWHMEMSRYLKDVDPYGHMVTTSISHRDIQGMNSIAYVDFNQKHIYKHTEAIPAIYPVYIQTFGKPYVVAEYGYRWEDADPKYGDLFDYDYRRGLWYGLFSPTPILPMSWWWELFDARNMMLYLRGVRELSEEMMRAGNGSFAPFELSAGLLESHGVRCGDTYFVYLLNNTASTVTTRLSFPMPGIAGYTLHLLNTDSAAAVVGSIAEESGHMVLNPVTLAGRKDLVLIVRKGGK